MHYYRYRALYTTSVNVVSRLEAKADRMLGEPPNFGPQARSCLTGLIRDMKRAHRLLDAMSRNKALGKDMSSGWDLISTLTQIAGGGGDVDSACNALKSWAQAYYDGVPAS